MRLYFVVQSIVSLTMLLRRQLVKYMQTTYAKIHFYFLLKKCENLLHCKRQFYNKNKSVFLTVTFKISTKCSLTSLLILNNQPLECWKTNVCMPLSKLFKHNGISGRFSGGGGVSIYLLL